MDIEFIDYKAIPSKKNMYDMQKMQVCRNVLKSMECHRISFEVFERYTKILFSYCPMKGASYDILVSEFISAQNNNDIETLANFNAFAKDECKILYEKFFGEPFHLDL